MLPFSVHNDVGVNSYTHKIIMTEHTILLNKYPINVTRPSNVGGTRYGRRNVGIHDAYHKASVRITYGNIGRNACACSDVENDEVNEGSSWVDDDDDDAVGATGSRTPGRTANVKNLAASHFVTGESIKFQIRLVIFLVVLVIVTLEAASVVVMVILLLLQIKSFQYIAHPFMALLPSMLLLRLDRRLSSQTSPERQKQPSSL